MTIKRVLLVTLFGLIFVMATRVPVDTDTWWHLRSGEYTLNNGMIYQDPFSHTKHGVDWTNHSWGAQVILYAVYELAGDLGLAVLTAALASGGMALLYPVCVGNPYMRAFVLLLGATAAAVFWSARPQMFSFFFSTLTLFILYKYKREEKDYLWAIPPMMLVWGNLHAGFSIGFILIGGFIAGEILNNLFNRSGVQVVSFKRLKKLILMVMIAVPALMVNPYGFDMLLVPFETVSIGALRQYIQEWQSPNFQGRETWGFIGLLIALIGILGASRRRLDWTDFVLLGGTLFMALLYGRNIAVFAVVAMPALTVHLDAFLQEQGWDFKPRSRVSRRQARLNMLLVILVVLGVVGNTVTVLNPQTVDQVQRERLPVQAAEFIATARPAGPMFNSYNWGGYLLWALPDYPVYVDGRTDLYGSDFLLRWLRAAFGQSDWRQILDDDGINLVVIEQGSGLDDRLHEADDWAQIYPNADYSDDTVVIYARQ
ncbi:MAG: hypothetical protein Kow00117_10950 [Phototrophicales bacterium]|nr:MAG: hypothetical protein D6711_13330 [Chloroflexota bacterium]